MHDLAGMYPAVNSISVVPVGVTKYREGLYPLSIYNTETAGAVIDQVEGFAAHHLERAGTRLAWCSDEFYLLAGRELPPEEYFEELREIGPDAVIISDPGVFRIAKRVMPGMEIHISTPVSYTHLTPAPSPTLRTGNRDRCSTGPGK